MINNFTLPHHLAYFIIAALFTISTVEAQSDIEVTSYPILIPPVATNGSIQVDVLSTAAPAPYFYKLLDANGSLLASQSTSNSSHVFTVVNPGGYCVEVIDNSGCVARSCFSVQQCRVSNSGSDVATFCVVVMDVPTIQMGLSEYPYIDGVINDQFSNQYNFSCLIDSTQLHVITDTVVMGHLVDELREILDYDSSNYSIHYQEEYISYSDYIYKFDEEKDEPIWINHVYGSGGSSSIKVKNNPTAEITVSTMNSGTLVVSAPPDSESIQTAYDFSVFSISGKLMYHEDRLIVNPHAGTLVDLPRSLVSGSYFGLFQDIESGDVISVKFVVLQ